MTVLRTVDLPSSIAGRLFLHSMPGRYESFGSIKEGIAGAGVSRVVCLAPLDEILRKSPDYKRAIDQGELPWLHDPFPVEDYQAPADREGFLRLARESAARLQSGENILIHCGAGIGRTGTLAVCVLMALGMAEPLARKNVRNAGSSPERRSQDEVIRWVAEQLQKK